MPNWFAKLLLATALFTTRPAHAADLKAQTTRLLEVWTGKAQSARTGTPQQLPADVVQSFDYETFATAAIEPHKARFSAAELAKFQQVFDQLLRKTVHKQAGAALGDTQYTVGSPADKNGVSSVLVKAHLPKDDLDTTVEFVWKKRGDAWRIARSIV